MSRLYLQNLFEFLYDFIEKKGRNFLFDRLDREDFVKVKDNTRIIRFVEMASLDDKLILCSKLGLRAALVLWDEGEEKPKKVHDVLIAYLDVPAHEMPRQLIRDKVFAVMDTDIIRAAQLISKASNSSTYTINRKYLVVKKAGKVYKPRVLTQKLEAENNLEWYIKTIEYALSLAPMVEAYGITLDQFRALLFLYNCPNGALKPALIQKANTGTRLLNQLVALNMINAKENIFNISTYGLIVVEKVISRFP